MLATRLRYFNLNNDAQLRARLAPGTAAGTSDLTIVAAEPRRFSADLFSDNAGFSSTGIWEVGAVLRGYRIFGDADRAAMVGVKSRGVTSGTLSLSTPIAQRIRVSSFLSYGRTKVLFGPVAPLGVRGSSYSFGGDAAVLIAADERATVAATGAVSTSLSETRIAGTKVLQNDVLNASLGLATTYAIPGLSASLKFQLTRAQVDERLSGTSVKPILFQGSALVERPLDEHFRLRLRGDWQLTTADTLPGVLQYQIG